MLRSRHVLILAKLGFLGLLLLALPGFALAVLYTEPFAGWRHAQAEALLSDAIGLDSSINGPIEIGFGWNPLITLTDIAGDRGDLATDVKEVSADRLALRISIPTLLTGKVDLNAIVVDGLKVDIDIPTDADAEKAGRKEDDDLAIGEFIQDFVRSQFSSDVTVNGLDLTFDNQETGFAMHYALDRIAATPSDAGAIAIAGAGSINNAPWTIEGEVAAPGDDDEFRNFTLTASQAGLTSKLSGRYAFDDEADRIDAALTGTSPALARLLEVYDIRGDLDGTGDISAKFSGALAKLALSDLGLKLNFKNGNSIELTGSAADVVAGTGLDLILTGKLVPQASSGEKPLYDLGVTGFTGRIAGAVDGVLVRDFHVTTTSLKAQLKEFGPISAERVWKDPEGRLGLYDVLVLAGDPKAPSVRVTGTVKNIIQFQGVDLKGAIDFRTADFLDLAAEENAEKLGHLKGNIALSDADGSLGIEALTAEVVNSVLLALRINLVFDDLNKADDLVFDTNLDIQNFKAFAATLGSDIEDLGAVAFNGKVTGSNERISASGTTNVGETVITGTLTGAFTGGRPVLSGDIATPILHLSDLTKLVSIRSVYLANVDNTDTDIIEYSQGWEKLFVDLQIKVAKISGGGPGTSNIQGRVTYGEGIVGLDPLTMSFLGGRASATGKIDTTGTENAFAVKGRVDNMQIGAILREMKVGYPVSGALQVSYDLTGAGSTMAQIPRSLGGSLTVNLRNGWIGTGLLDLAGLSLPAWLLTRGNGKSANVACLVAPFNFTSGRGVTHGLVMETLEVQVVGVGYVDFRKDYLDLRFKPKALREQFLKIAQPFAIQGPMSKPQLRLTGAPVAGAVTDVLSFPFNLLGTILQPDARQPGRVPCRVVHATAGRPGNAQKGGIMGGGILKLPFVGRP